MRRWLVAAAAFSMVTASAYATDDPIFTRQTLMNSNGGAAGAAVALLRGDIPYNANVARSVFLSMKAVAYAYGDYFPEGSDVGDTAASPRIWEDRAAFNATLENFQQAVDAALAANPPDLPAFREVFNQVGQSCNECHNSFRSN